MTMSGDLAKSVDQPASVAPARRNGLLVSMWRRRLLFLGAFFGVFAVVVLAFVLLPVTYLATGSVIVAEQEPGIANASAAWAQKIGDPADLESQLLMIRSPRVIRLAAAETGTLETALLECHHDTESRGLSLLRIGQLTTCDKIKTDEDAFVDYLQSRYFVGSVGRSRVINISYKSTLPEAARGMVNALITAFLEDQRSNLSKGREVAATWLWDELRRLDAELHDEDAKIQTFRTQKGLMRGANAPINSERLTSTSQQLATAEAARAEAAARLQEIKAGQSRGSSEASAVLSSRAIADLKQQMTAVNGQLILASSVLGPRHPTLQALQREYASLQAQFAQEVAVLAANAEKAYVAADAVVATLRGQLETVKTEVAKATVDEASIESMVRGVEIKRTQYSDLHKRASELETERRVLLGSTRLVNLAELPNVPFFPKRLPFVIAGFVIAFLFAAVLVLWRDRSDRTVRGASELVLTTGVLMLARVPQLIGSPTKFARGILPQRNGTLSHRAALDAAQKDEAFQEALRKIHGSLVFATGNRKTQTVLVASPGTREGKTFLMLALARFVAASGRRVLVVECDMRRPSIKSTLGLEGDHGLLDVLQGSIAAPQALATRVIPELDILPAGGPVTESIDGLVANRMPEFIRWAQTYDLVLLDGTSSDSLIDTCMLAKYADGILCCARWGQTSIDNIIETLNGIRSVGGHVLGTVITMVNPGDYRLYEPALTSTASIAYLKAS